MMCATSRDANVPLSFCKRLSSSSCAFSSPSRATRLIASPSSKVRDITQRCRSRVRQARLKVASRWLVPTNACGLCISDRVAGDGWGVFFVEAFTERPSGSTYRLARVSGWSYRVERSSQRGCPQMQTAVVHSRSCDGSPNPFFR